MIQKRKLSPRTREGVFLLAAVLFMLLISMAGCSDRLAADAIPDDQSVVAELFPIDFLAPGDFPLDHLPVFEWEMNASLYIGDGPGQPAEPQEQTSQESERTIFSELKDNLVLRVLSPSRVLAAPVIQPNQPLQPTDPAIMDPTPPRVQVLNPQAGSQIAAGDPFTLRWTVDAQQDLSVDILFSTDGGVNYQEIANRIPHNNAYRLTIPDVRSDRCIFRVNVWEDTDLLGYNTSPVFQVVSPPIPADEPPAPTGPALTAPQKNYPPSTYVSDNSTFIHEAEDGIRWFYVDHEESEVHTVLWQMSRIPFPSSQDLNELEAPGLLAWGRMKGDTNEFSVDFDVIMAHLTDQRGRGSLIHEGVSFETLPAITLMPQHQRELYVRVLLLDEQETVIGATRSQFQIVYGRPILDSAGGDGTHLFPDLPVPTMQVKTTAGFGMGYYEDIPEAGLLIYAAGDRDWQFSIEEIPPKAVDIELQISTQPYGDQNAADFLNPAGLVHRIRESGVSHTVTTHYFPVSFQEFAPALAELGENTITYYVRTVCYVPGEGTGTVVPMASQIHKVHYTGDQQLYILKHLDFETLPPEDVVVRSYVPDTHFSHYQPPQWPLHRQEDWFTVTRSIRAEEVSFFVKDHGTSDFLYPYPVHVAKFPQTTYDQYQDQVDQLLPPGAWFRLSIAESDGEAMWEEFYTVLNQIQAALRRDYNGLKKAIPTRIGNRFSDLGSPVQNYSRGAVQDVLDYGLTAVGLPPSLPNFQHLSAENVPYTVQVALAEAAHAAGVPPEQIPARVRREISAEIKAQLGSLGEMQDVNPLHVDYLQPAGQAMYRPAWVDVNIHNPHDRWSPSGTMTLSYYPVGKPHINLYQYASLPVPALAPKDTILIRVFLKPDNTDLPIWKEYFWGKTGECELVLNVVYHVQDMETAAKEQGAQSEIPHRPAAYVFDRDPVVTFRKISPPSHAFSD